MILHIEYNAKRVRDLSQVAPAYMVTPPIGSEDYWLARVPLSSTQAIVAFPKFGVIGIGFQQEDDWNTNLPSTCEAEKIFAHISHNKGDPSIADADCLTAIRMIQDAIAKAMAQEIKS